MKGIYITLHFKESCMVDINSVCMNACMSFACRVHVLAICSRQIPYLMHDSRQDNTLVKSFVSIWGPLKDTIYGSVGFVVQRSNGALLNETAQDLLFALLQLAKVLVISG